MKLTCAAATSISPRILNPSAQIGKDPKVWQQGFPGGAVVKNLPANGRDTGSSPGLERSHMLQSN